MAELDKAIQIQQDILESSRSSTMDKATAVEMLKSLEEVSDRRESSGLAERIDRIENALPEILERLKLLERPGKGTIGSD